MTTSTNALPQVSERKPVIFISGPMTGIENYNRDAFHHEASQLRHIGFTVLNPAIFPDGLEHHQYLAMTLVMLEQADAIYLLDGWENSVGAKAEVIRARELNLMFLGQSWEVLWAAAAFRPALRAAMLVQERSNGGHDGKISD
ncbi:DUF4406 domain-containing protein [Serratia ureilytica]|uniref:DUF4406 domain-containing protein n=1 Tax=Serratia marcescens TaxID=615 RepID=UPI000744F73E|nr:DUF4406 domain-containing protein [Serratia marcescens]CUZ68090.1 Uncharacterised protein [Serratia marcescens]CVF21395.1 Uncharacterised protein [Serratia marcescens]CVG48678.1 Uncharacterised protein [Serratia marcescens]